MPQNSTPFNRRHLLVLAIAGVVASPLLRNPIEQKLLAPPPSLPPPLPKLPPRLNFAQIQPHLDLADENSLAAIEQQVGTVAQFFVAARQGLPAFCDDIVSWSSKIRFIADYIPFTAGDRHERYLRRQFESRIFSGSQLSQTLQQAADQYFRALNSIENEMLLALRLDLANYPEQFAPARLEANHFQVTFARAIQAASAETEDAIEQELCSVAVSAIATKVMSQVASRLGVSGAVLAAGSAAGLATLGLSLLVSLIIDQLIEWIWNWWSNRQGKLLTELSDRLLQLEKLVCDGEQPTVGLRGELTNIAARRAELRRQAVREMIDPCG